MKWITIIKLLFLSWLIIFSKYNAVSQSNLTSVKTVVIDAGHGGKDPGAVGHGLKEKDITLSIALKLGKLIKDNCKDVKVVFTRSSDEFVELFKRAKIANNAKADLFISIHVNSSKKNEPYGTETYVMGLSKSDENLEVAMTENAVILKEENYQKQYEGFDPHSPEAYIIFSLFQNAYLDLSLTFSSFVQNEYVKIQRENRGVKQAGFLVLWNTTMPSVLTEVGFLSNSEDARYLADERNHWLFAKSLFNAFSRYKGYLENEKYIELTYEDVQQYVKETKMLIDNNKYIKANKDTTLIKINTDSLQASDFQHAANQLVNYFSNDSIYFYVQIASSDKSIKQFKISNVEEILIDNSYKYLCCKSSKYSEVVDKQKEIKKIYPDAFVVALKNGKKISINEALKKTKN